MSDTTPTLSSGTSDRTPSPRTHSVHVRDVPEAVWCRARQNALLSGLPFKKYITRLLAESTPFPPQAGGAS